jgi:hypothetical protein
MTDRRITFDGADDRDRTALVAVPVKAGTSVELQITDDGEATGEDWRFVGWLAGEEPMAEGDDLTVVYAETVSRETEPVSG